MHDKSLLFIDDDLVQTGNFLKDISSNKNKLKFIEDFSQCLQLVEWIKQETKGTINKCNIN